MNSRSRANAAARPQTVLVFQGGGALGAYQAGVYEALQADGINADWLVGTSIGAINAALIAGNEPAQRLRRLRDFWELVAQERVPGLAQAPWSMPWLAGLQTWQTMLAGVPGFFRPRTPTPWDLSRPMALSELSFYDTTPLRKTLQDLIDFKYLNRAETRLTLCAVDVTSGEPAMFDNRRDDDRPIGPEHIMASGALPPGFAPVVIKATSEKREGVAESDRAYWDGGVYSNTPLDIVLDDAERRDTLCFMVDLWDASEAAPRTLSEAMTRLKDIQYASRSKEHIDDHKRMQNLRRAVRLLGGRLDPATVNDPGVRKLLDLGSEHAIDVVHLVMKALPGESAFRDIDFSRETLQARWAAGVRDGRRALQHRSWLTPPPDHLGMRVHTLPQDK